MDYKRGSTLSEVVVLVLLRIRKINLISTITIVLILISLLSTVSAVTDKDTLIVQIEESILHIDNRYRSASSVFDEIVASQYQGYLGMIAPGETIAIMPGVAESWHLTYGDEHVIEWVFQLREGLTFHDGSPIDAKSIKYSMVANLMAYYSYDNMSHALREWEDDGYEVGFPANDPNGDGLTVIFSGEYFPDPMFPFDVMGAWNRFTLVPYGVQGLL